MGVYDIKRLIYCVINPFHHYRSIPVLSTTHVCDKAKPPFARSYVAPFATVCSVYTAATICCQADIY